MNDTGISTTAWTTSGAVLGTNSGASPPLESERRCKVLHVINGEFYSGAERVQDLLAKELPRDGFEVGFVCLKPEKFPACRKATAAPLYPMPMASRFDLRVVSRISRIVEQEGYEIIHAHTPRSLWISRFVAARTQVRLVYHVHSPANNDCTHRLRNLANGWFERFGLRRADAIIPVSHSLAELMASQGYSRSKIFHVANGVPVPRTIRNPVPPSSNWTIGTVALFRPRKGLEFLIEALALLRTCGIRVRLRAIGSFETGEYEHQIRDLVHRLELDDFVEWTGFVRDVEHELSKLDCVVLPSLFGEGLPMVVLEAMAAGVPIIATDVDGVREAIEHRRDGLLARPGDPDDLANCIRDMVTGQVDWMELRRSALERHFKEFSDRAMAGNVAQVYRHLLASCV